MAAHRKSGRADRKGGRVHRTTGRIRRTGGARIAKYSHTLCTPPSFRLLSARTNHAICSIDKAFSLHSTNGRKQKSRQKALK